MKRRGLAGGGARGENHRSPRRGLRPYLTQSVGKAVLQMLIPPQIRQLILYYL